MSEPRLFLDFCGPTRVTAERAPCWFNKHIREQSVGAKPMGLLNSVQRVQDPKPTGFGCFAAGQRTTATALLRAPSLCFGPGGLKPPARAD